MKISWFKFSFLFSLFILIINLRLIYFCYKEFSQDNLLLSLSLMIAYFSLIYIIMALLFMRYLTKLIAVIFVLSSLYALYFNYFYGILIDPNMIENIIKTDMKEVSELINLPLILLSIVALILAYLIFKLKIIYPNFKKHLAIKFGSILVAVLVFLCTFMPFTQTYIPFFRVNNQIKFYNTPFYQLYSLLKYYQIQMHSNKELKIISQDASIADKTKKKLLILVLGETARAENFSLGTYSKNDTNFYTKKEDLVYFSNVSSCGTSTAHSLPCMLSFSKRSEFSKREFQENALDILQKLGVKVSWLGNNSGGCQGLCTRLNDVVSLRADYDEALLAELKTRLQSLENQNLIVLHLQGSHGPAYYKRYPDEFKRFKPTCDTNQLEKCSLEALENTYDNTLLYTDFILSEIITMLKQYKDYEGSLLYVSDHGESLGENGIYLHSIPFAIAPSAQTHVPLIFYSAKRGGGGLII